MGEGAIAAAGMEAAAVAEVKLAIHAVDTVT